MLGALVTSPSRVPAGPVAPSDQAVATRHEARGLVFSVFQFLAKRNNVEHLLDRARLNRLYQLNQPRPATCSAWGNEPLPNPASLNSDGDESNLCVPSAPQLLATPWWKFI
jgi:hypothetical protein